MLLKPVYSIPTKIRTKKKLSTFTTPIDSAGSQLEHKDEKKLKGVQKEMKSK